MLLELVIIARLTSFFYCPNRLPFFWVGILDLCETQDWIVTRASGWVKGKFHFWGNCPFKWDSSRHTTLFRLSQHWIWCEPNPTKSDNQWQYQQFLQCQDLIPMETYLRTYSELHAQGVFSRLQCYRASNIYIYTHNWLKTFNWDVSYTLTSSVVHSFTP